VLTLAEPTNLGPSSLTALPFIPTPALVAKAQGAPPNGMQKALAKLAVHFPGAAPTEDISSFVANHVDRLAAEPSPREIPTGADVSTTAAASAFIQARVAPFIATFSTATSKVTPVIDDTKFTGANDGLSVPGRKLSAGLNSILISGLDRADPPAPYRPGDVSRTQTFNANILSITADPPCRG
jgi:hypothetical protein